MIKQHNLSKTRKSKHLNPACRSSDGGKNLDDVAEELDELARKFLPDKAPQGAYSGHEADMRQEAILMALGWYLRQKMDPAAKHKHPWHPPRAIAAALQIQRRDYAKALKRDAVALQAMPPDGMRAPYHPSLAGVGDWSVSTLEAMLREAIRRALLARRISHTNAAVASGVVIDGISATEMAQRLGVHRSVIYHHLGRVRRELPDIIDGIEVPLHDFF